MKIDCVIVTIFLNGKFQQQRPYYKKEMAQFIFSIYKQYNKIYKKLVEE